MHFQSDVDEIKGKIRRKNNTNQHSVNDAVSMQLWARWPPCCHFQAFDKDIDASTHCHMCSKTAQSEQLSNCALATKLSSCVGQRAEIGKRCLVLMNSCAEKLISLWFGSFFWGTPLKNQSVNEWTFWLVRKKQRKRTVVDSQEVFLNSRSQTLRGLSTKPPPLSEVPEALYRTELCGDE